VSCICVTSVIICTHVIRKKVKKTDYYGKEHWDPKADLEYNTVAIKKERKKETIE
jgi:hypothetical protein